MMAWTFPTDPFYFVTECTKSMNWGIGAFYSRSEAHDYLRYISDQDSCQWKCRGEARTGSKGYSNSRRKRQCVFLRGYKIMLRPDIWKKLKDAIVVGCWYLRKHYSNDWNNVRLMQHDEVALWPGVLWSTNFCTKQSLILH